MTAPPKLPSSPAPGEDSREAAGRGRAARIHASFARQAFMATLGASLVEVEPGRVVIEMARQEALTQQHGFVHAGAIASVVDSACGYAALSVMDEGTGVLSVEFKVNLIRPAAGERFRATGTVEQAGRTLVICRGEAEAWDGGAWKRIALMQATMMCLRDRTGLVD